MTDSAASTHKDELRATRAQLAKVIRRRPKVGALTAMLLAAAFASVAALVVAMDLLLASAGEPSFRAGEPSPMTVRVPHFSRVSGGLDEIGPVVVARGQTLWPETVNSVERVRANLPAPGALGGYFVILFTVALLYSIHLRGSHRGQLLRTQAYGLMLLLGGALAVKMALLLSPMSVFLVPVAAVAMVAAVVVDRSVGLSTALLASVVMGLLVPFDPGAVAVLLLQSATACLLAGDRKSKNTRLILAGLAGGAAAAVGYAVLYYLTRGHLPLDELKQPLRSALAASLAGGALGGLLAIPLKPLYQFMLGDITKSKLVELEDLSNPLLRQIAENSPGTWQHSLAMANMAEIAANAIGADGRLVRVGAYYHDLGKSLQPKYFIENLDSGESSPHDRLPPDISCDAIFAHVTEGIRVARQHHLPERIIDFMYMHHGDGLLEYFWAKCRDSGNPQGLTEADFRYPGVPPQNRETAILAICDAVEAASRTLKKPDERAIESLVQRIVYGKLHLGQLDQSGMSMSDLRKISDSLRETIKHAHHGRIEYPWQREEKKAADAAVAVALPPPPGPQPALPEEALPPPAPRRASTTQRIIHEPRLDSLDTPRPYYWADRGRPSPQQRPAVETAPTEPIEAASNVATSSAGNTASHSTLPVEIESVVEAPEDQGTAPTMPLVMSESQSMAAPPRVSEADEAEEAPEAADAGPETQAAAAPPVERAASEDAGGAAAELDFSAVAAESTAAARSADAAPAADAAATADAAPAADARAGTNGVGAREDEGSADAEDAEDAGEQDAPVPMGRAVTGPPPATRTGPVSRLRDKTKSGTKVGFPGAGQPAPEPGTPATARPSTDAGAGNGAGTRPGTDAGHEEGPGPRAETDTEAAPGPAAPDQAAASLRSSGLAK